MASNQYERSETPQQQSRNGLPTQLQTFKPAKGYSGASPSRDIPVLPLISRPLKQKSSDILSALTTAVRFETPPTPKKTTAYKAFNELPEMTPVSPLYDHSPNHLIQTKKKPSGSSITQYPRNQFPQAPKTDFGTSASKGTYKNQPESSKRKSTASTSKGAYNDQQQSSRRSYGASTSKGNYNDQPRSSRGHSGVSFSKDTSGNASTSREECSPSQKVMTKPRGYPWHDVPLISHESLRVTKGSADASGCRDASEVLREADVVVRPSPTRHPSTVSHLYYHWGKKRHVSSPNRVVPPFSIQALQKNTVVAQPPKVNVQEEKPPKPSRFKMMYFRGDLPVRALPSFKGNVLKWTANIDELDYNVYLPLFFEGLRYKEEPWCFFARQGCLELLERHSSRVLDTVGHLVKPIKDALETRNKAVMCHTLKIVQKLICCAPNVGKALIPHLHAILPILNRFLNDKFFFEETRFGLRGTKTLGEVIDDTLRVMEEYGGRDAYLYIKLIVPTYETCGLNKIS